MGFLRLLVIKLDIEVLVPRVWGKDFFMNTQKKKHYENAGRNLSQANYDVEGSFHRECVRTYDQFNYFLFTAHDLIRFFFREGDMT